MKNGSLQDDGICPRVQASGTRKHGESFWINSGKGDFRAVIDCLVPPPAKPANLVALFDGRASYTAIQHWRAGRKAPAWAIDLACGKLRQHLNTAHQLIQGASRWIGAADRRGAAGTRALAAWRERKAREKEKAAEVAALQHETKNNS